MIKHGGIFLGKVFFKKAFLWLGFILLLCSGFCFCMVMEPVPLVIFAGGGSVRNYLDSVDSVKIDSLSDYGMPKSVYINMPSEYVWALLKEEIVRFKDNPGNRPFLYICLSAGTINKDSIEKIGLKNEDEHYAHIYGFHIGDDELMVYLKDTNQKGDTISYRTLKGKVNSFSKKNNSQKDGKLYVTSRKSGTLRKYQEILDVNFDTIINSLFYAPDTLKDTGRVLVLGSRYYKPTLNSKDSRGYYVIDEKNDTVKKPLYLYFVVFAKDDFKPNKQIVDFFEQYLKINNLRELINANDSPLTHLDLRKKKK